jgi:parallel beta-helix repeat protein
MIAIEAPFPQFFDKDGSPLDHGYLYFGVANQNPETDQIPVYWDAAGTQPAAQPIRTLNGYPARSGTPAAVFVDGYYSLTVKSRRGALVIYSANSAKTAGFGGATTADLSSFGAVYGSTLDAAFAFQLAFAFGVKEILVSGNITLKTQVVVPSGTWITFSRGAVCSLDTTTFTGARNTATAVAFLFNGCVGGGITWGWIKPSSYVDDRALVAVRMMSSSNVNIMGVEMSGFSKANGIVSIDTCTDCNVYQPYIHDCTTDSASTGQVTGITVDDNRIGGVSSTRCGVYGGTIRDITVGPAFLAAFGYQSDGITVEVGTTEFVIEGVKISNTGEGIDYWGSGGSVVGNTIRNSYIFGIKLLHSANNNTVVGNEIFGSGLAGITLQGSSTDTGDTNNNLIADNNIAGIDPSGAWAASTTGCILISDGTWASPPNSSTFTVRGNTFQGNKLNPGPGGKFCIVRSASTDTGNTFPENNFVAAGSLGYVSDNALSLGRITATNKTLALGFIAAPQVVNASTAAKVAITTRLYDDNNEIDVVNSRASPHIPTIYEIDGQVTLGTVVGASKTGVLEIRVNGSVGSGVLAPALMTTGMSYQVFARLALNVGDYVELWYTNGDTSNVTLNNGSAKSFLAIKQA